MNRSSNPLLWYQLFGFTINRWRRQPLLYGAVAVGFGLVYLLVYQMFRYVEAGLAGALNISIFIMCLAAPLMAYNLFSLEYEKQTWESLALTRLTAKEIIWGKWGAAMARVGVLTLIFVPMMLASESSPNWAAAPPDGTGELRAYTFLAAVASLFSWGALLVSLGMWLSFKLKRTISTASALYAGQVFALALLPTLYTIFGDNDRFYSETLKEVSSYWDGFLWWIIVLFHPRVLLHLNPFYIGAELQTMVYYDIWGYPSFSSRGTGLYYAAWGFAQSMIYLTLAMLFAGFTYRGLKIAWRK